MACPPGWLEGLLFTSSPGTAHPLWHQYRMVSFFVYLTERNRLAMVFKDGTWHQVFLVWGGYYLRVVRMGWHAVFAWIRRNPIWRQQAGPLKITSVSPSVWLCGYQLCCASDTAFSELRLCPQNKFSILGAWIEYARWFIQSMVSHTGWGGEASLAIAES